LLSHPHWRLALRPGSVAWCVVVCGAALHAIPIAAQVAVPIGPELQVNSYTTFIQNVPRASMTADGAFVVVWESYGQDGSYRGVFAQRFDSTGAPLAIEFKVNTFTDGNQYRPSIDAEANGDFVVVWASPNNGISAQRFDSSGGAQGGEVKVNSYTPAGQSEPAVALDADGDFVVAWTTYLQDGQGNGVAARRFNSAGAAQGLDFQVNLTTANTQRRPAVAADADGDFAIAWDSANQDGQFGGVLARRFDSSGAAQSGELAVNEHTLGAQIAPAIGMDFDGDFVVAWESFGQDALNTYGVFGRRFDSTGSALGGELRVSLYDQNHQRSAALAMASAGDFVVTWQSAYQDGSSTGVFGRRFTPSGLGLLSEFQVNAFTTSVQGVPAVAADDDRDFVVAWQSFGQDGNNLGVFAQRFIGLDAIGDNFLVNTYTFENQSRPVLAMNADGAFAVAWNSLHDGDGGVFARRFDSAAAPQGPDFQINAVTLGTQTNPSVGIDGEGDFVMAWGDGSMAVAAQRFSAGGERRGVELAVNESTFNASDPEVAVEADGDFILVWSRPDGFYADVFGRRFASSGSSLGAEFRVNAHTLASHVRPAVAFAGDGDFVVAWESGVPPRSVFGQRFDSVGNKQGTEFQVNTNTVHDHRRADLAADGDGDLVVVWEKDVSVGVYRDILARRFASDGIGSGPEFQVNVSTVGAQSNPSVAIDVLGDFVVVWQRESVVIGYRVYARAFAAAGGASGDFPLTASGLVDLSMNRYPDVGTDEDGDFIVVWQRGADLGEIGNDVFGRRFAGFSIGPTTATANLDIDDNGSFGALTDGLLALRYFFGFRGATLVTGAIGPGAQRDTAPEVEAYVAANLTAFDIDGNGSVEPLTDGLLILRYLFGFRGETLIDGAIGSGATRNTAQQIETYIAGLS
jgi:hypothetical protein